ncbi:hypothetical protein [Natrinema pallidum]|uniref:Uncharacterized protein n=1 Tax=Natrinema pallidum DSM 3751 TaxID=1227495 RepID=L9YGF9_9EURY|nr:hypothetical protein [Natrinema pallidum]ELY73210.1 hypothetical protein C487_17450 [Natrinema pallidum DSM 3751]
MSVDVDASDDDLLGQPVDEAFIERMRERLLSSARSVKTDGDDLVNLAEQFQAEADVLADAYDGVDGDELEAEILETFDEAIVLQHETAKDIDDRPLAERVQDRVDAVIDRVLGRTVGETNDAGEGDDRGAVGDPFGGEATEAGSETIGSPFAGEGDTHPAADPNAEDVVGRSDEDRIATEIRALRDQRIAALADQTDMTYREIGESFDVTAATVARAVEQYGEAVNETEAETETDIAGALPEQATDGEGRP